MDPFEEMPSVQEAIFYAKRESALRKFREGKRLSPLEKRILAFTGPLRAPEEISRAR